MNRGYGHIAVRSAGNMDIVARESRVNIIAFLLLVVPLGTGLPGPWSTEARGPSWSAC